MFALVVLYSDKLTGEGGPQVVAQLPQNPFAVIFGLSSMSYIFFVGLEEGGEVPGQGADR
jgi:hypothetical protein